MIKTSHLMVKFSILHLQYHGSHVVQCPSVDMKAPFFRWFLLVPGILVALILSYVATRVLDVFLCILIGSVFPNFVSDVAYRGTIGPKILNDSIIGIHLLQVVGQLTLVWSAAALAPSHKLLVARLIGISSLVLRFCFFGWVYLVQLPIETLGWHLQIMAILSTWFGLVVVKKDCAGLPTNHSY